LSNPRSVLMGCFTICLQLAEVQSLSDSKRIDFFFLFVCSLLSQQVQSLTNPRGVLVFFFSIRMQLAKSSVSKFGQSSKCIR